jgi:hypothetical protein
MEISEIVSHFQQLNLLSSRMLLFAKENMFGDSGKVESTFKIIKKYWYIKIIRLSIPRPDFGPIEYLWDVVDDEIREM